MRHRGAEAAGNRALRAFLHIGAGKTGTSAIQVALAQLRPALAARGVWYPQGFGNTDARAEQGRISSGNAAALGPWLNPNHRRPGYDKAAVTAWLDACLAEAAGRDLLLSSEMMQFPRPEEAAELCARLAGKGHAPVVIFYVRHALDQAVATWLQHLKRGFVGLPRRETIHGLGDFLHQHRCTYLASLSPFAKALPAEQIVVRLYDDEAPLLVPGFLRLLGQEGLAVPAGGKVVNRSPAPAEQVVFQALGRLPNGPALCQIAADLMLNRAAPSGPQPVSRAEAEAFSARNQPVVDEINRRFLRGRGTLRMMSDRIEVGETPAVAPDQVYSVFAEGFALLAADPARGAHRAAG